MAKLGIDWLVLRTEYKTGGIKSVNEFLRRKGIKINGNSSRQTKGWATEKELYQNKLQRKMEEKSQNKIAEAFGADVAEIRMRHSKIARYIQTKALRTLQGKDFETASQAVRAIETAVQAERGAVGMDRDNGRYSGIENLPTINTRYGQDLTKMDFEQLIAVLKRLKELEQKDNDTNQKLDN